MWTEEQRAIYRRDEDRYPSNLTNAEWERLKPLIPEAAQGKKYVMHAGDIMIIPPNVPHEFRFTQDTIDIDIFSPQRQDWMDGTADYFSKK